MTEEDAEAIESEKLGVEWEEGSYREERIVENLWERKREQIDRNLRFLFIYLLFWDFK